LAGREGRSASHYTITAAGRRLRASFVPRADSRHLLVAAASMTAKYLRELWMELFNSFWTRQLPDLEPTAGYPTDARRFWRKIQPLTDRLGVARQLIWRER
jgi:ribonuclease HII